MSGVNVFRWLDAVSAAPELIGKDKAIRVAVRLLVRADGNGRRAFPGRKRLAQEVGVSVGTVDTALRLLRDLGWIVRVEKGSTGAKRNYADVYDLAFPVSHSAVRGSQNAESDQSNGFDQSQSWWDQSQSPVDQSQFPADQSQPRLLPTYPSTPTPSITAPVSKNLSEADASGAPAPDMDDWFDRAFDWIEDQVEGFDGFEASTATGMLNSGSHPKTVVNTLRKRR